MLIGESGDGMHSRDCKSKRGQGLECRGWDSVRHRIDHDLNGAPVSAATVTYAAPSSGASATLSTATAATNSSGIATVMATANFLAGMYNIAETTTSGTTAGTFSLTNSDIQIAANSPALTVPRGSKGTDTITLTALGSFNAASGSNTVFPILCASLGCGSDGNGTNLQRMVLADATSTTSATAGG